MAVPRTIFVCLVLSMLAVANSPVVAGSSPPGTPSGSGAKSRGAKVFVGHVRTMDENDSVAEAVAVDARGVITAVGTVEQARKVAGPGAVEVRLTPGQTLLPGFIDGHVHVVAMLQEKAGFVKLVGACRPDPYKAVDCYKTIQDALASLKRLSLKPPADDNSSLFIMALNLDPSRQPYDLNTGSEEFKRCPAYFIEKEISAKQPVLITDQSGHFGYVNHVAFDRLHDSLKAKSKKDNQPEPPWPPKLPDGGEWNVNDPQSPCGTSYTGPNAQFTGLLTEIPGYTPFFQPVQDGAQGQLVEDFKENVTQTGEALVRKGGKAVLQLMRDLREAGLTTVTSFAQTAGTLRITKVLAELPVSGTRILSVVTPDLGKSSPGSKPEPPRCDPTKTADCRLPKNLGVNGIKTIADGSTQGCTAALSSTPQQGPQYLATSECKQHPEGRINFDPPEELRKQLADLWTRGWRFETHANGNRAIEMVLGVYASLQAEKENHHTATLIHATVGDESLWKLAGALKNGSYPLDGKKVPAINLHVSHTIAHVAYWGGVFERQLGNAVAANIDPVGFDREQGIPFTLHSDATVSVSNPLWFIRQAVTRETWKYPNLGESESHVLGPQHAATVREALQAVTITAAQEKEIDQWVGSIKVGKVADFVVLSQDPMDLDPAKGGDPKKITGIKVVSTYLGGRLTGGK